jgi:predicted nuclease of predicted toxin-antitoxin system
MRILIDEDLDVRLRNDFGSEHEAITVRYRGWTGMKNR